eukprot:1161083-Pelagomonas_calceolata.AAC.7
MEPGASSKPPDPHKHFYFQALWWRGLTALLSPCVSSSLIDVGRDPSAYVAPSVTRNMRVASKGPLTHYALSQAVIN